MSVLSSVQCARTSQQDERAGLERAERVELSSFCLSVTRMVLFKLSRCTFATAFATQLCPKRPFD